MSIIRLFILLFFFSISPSFAQSLYGNEWIDYEKEYLRIPVAKDGWYFLSSNYLQEMGFPWNQQTTYSLFKQGHEVKVTVADSGLFFLGERNDGFLDQELYANKYDQPNSAYSLFTDTTAYFLTYIKNVINQTGVEESKLSKIGTIHRSPYVSVTEKIVDNSDYSAGIIYPLGATYANGIIRSEYDQGEGWMSLPISTEKVYKRQIDLGCMPDSVRIKIYLIGRKVGNHQAKIKINGKNIGLTAVWSDYSSYIYEVMDSSKVDKPISIEVLSTIHSIESLSVAYIEVEFYTSLANLSTNKNRFVKILKSGERNDEFLWINTTDRSNSNPIMDRCFVDNSEVMLVTRIQTPINCRKVCFNRIPSKVDYLIITHPQLNYVGSSVDKFASYRSSEMGGSHSVYVTNSWNLYDEFNYGQPGGLALQRAIDWYADFRKIKHVFLMGKSIDPQTARKNGTTWTEDWVPNAGWPGSDLGLLSKKVRSQVAIGRLNAKSEEEVANYLEKVMDYESSDEMGSLVHVSGGITNIERSEFRDYESYYSNKIKSATNGYSTVLISKENDKNTENLGIQSWLDRGTSLLNYFGHSNLLETDVELPLTPNIGQQKIYPIVIANGCSLGNSFYRSPALGDNWIKAQKSGAIIFLGHTHNGLMGSMFRYTDFLYEVMLDTLYNSKSLGEMRSEAVRRYLWTNPTMTDSITASQMNLLGDPAIRPWKRPNNSRPIEVDCQGNKEVLLFPNPVRENLRIRSTIAAPKTAIGFKVYSVLGQLIYENNYSIVYPSKEITFDVSHWHRGVYIIQLTIDGCSQIHRVYKL